MFTVFLSKYILKYTIVIVATLFECELPPLKLMRLNTWSRLVALCCILVELLGTRFSGGIGLVELEFELF